MLIEASASDFEYLLAGQAPPPFLPLPGSAIAPAEVLRMLADLAASIRPHFAPCAWMIVEDHAVVGLLSVVTPPADGRLVIGYGVAPGARGRGVARRAVGEIVAWATSDARVELLAADTGVDNLPSQRVLASNGFRNTGTSEHPEDGALLNWELQASPCHPPNPSA